MAGPNPTESHRAAREKFLSLSLESTRKSYYPQLLKHLEAEKETARRMALLIDSLPARISYIDMEKRYVFVNRAYEEAFESDRTQITGKHVSTIIGEKYYRNIEGYMDAALSGKMVRFETPATGKGGRKLWLEVSYVPDINENHEVVGFYGLVLDITDKKRDEEERVVLEKRLMQAQKMESLGTLAGGVAHDFNNILSPILGFAELIQAELPTGAPYRGYADGIIGAALRARDLVQQILAFSRQTTREVLPIKLQPILKEALKLLRSSIPATIDIRQNIRSDCGIVMADPTQVHQILMNLVTNAFHAMEDKGGTLTVSLEEIFIEPDQAVSKELSPGKYALLKVTDTGTGIEKHILDRVFEPYFTTKAKNKGTGLGLSVVQGIVKSFHGDIRMYSEVGKGTEVRVYLPITGQESNIPVTTSPEPVPGGSERLLLVDDEEGLVKMEQGMLSKLGYQATACVGSIEALRVFSSAPDGFDLVMTDLTMPDVTGIQLATEIKKIRPDIPILLCTGFSDQLNEENINAMGLQGFLLKPLIRRETALAIRNALDRSEK